MSALSTPTVHIVFNPWNVDGKMGLASGIKKENGHKLDEDDDDDVFSLVSAANSC